jgi:hypothetical protein
MKLGGATLGRQGCETQTRLEKHHTGESPLDRAKNGVTGPGSWPGSTGLVNLTGRQRDLFGG